MREREREREREKERNLLVLVGIIQEMYQPQVLEVSFHIEPRGSFPE